MGLKKKKQPKQPDLSQFFRLLQQQSAVPTPDNSATELAQAAEQERKARGRASTYLGFGSTQLAQDFQTDPLQLL